MLARLIYICDSTGTLKTRLTLEENPSYHVGDSISLQCVTDQNELVMCTSKNGLVYTTEGKLKRTKKAEHVNRSVTYNYQTSKLEILVRKELRIGTTTSFSILSYSENGEVERLNVPVKDFGVLPKVFNQPVGPGVIRIFQRLSQSLIVFI